MVGEVGGKKGLDHTASVLFVIGEVGGEPTLCCQEAFHEPKTLESEWMEFFSPRKRESDFVFVFLILKEYLTKANCCYVLPKEYLEIRQKRIK